MKKYSRNIRWMPRYMGNDVWMVVKFVDGRYWHDGSEYTEVEARHRSARLNELLGLNGGARC